MSTRPIVHLCPALRQLDACNWELLEDVHHRMADGREVCVPAGFVFDFASIPQLFWSVVGSQIGRAHV